MSDSRIWTLGCVDEGLGHVPRMSSRPRGSAWREEALTAPGSRASSDISGPQLPLALGQEDPQSSVQEKDPQTPPAFHGPADHQAIIVPLLLIGQHLQTWGGGGKREKGLAITQHPARNLQIPTLPARRAAPNANAWAKRAFGQSPPLWGLRGGGRAGKGQVGRSSCGQM